MPEIHSNILDLLSITIAVLAISALLLQAVRFLIAAIMQPTDE